MAVVALGRCLVAFLCMGDSSAGACERCYVAVCCFFEDSVGSLIRLGP